MKFARAGYVSWPKSMSEPMTRPDGLVRWIAACAIFSLALATVFGFVVRGQDGSGRTLGFLLLTLMVGLIAIYKMSVRLNDVLFLRFAYVFIASLAITLLILGPRWNDHLAAGGARLEGDQERYYFQASEFARDGFRIDKLPSLNYTGVLFIYGALFALAGQNPYAPMLLNTLAVLAATLLLARVGYKIKPKRDRTDWTIGFCLFVPEVLLHCTMPSRDILAMVLLSISVLSAANYLLGIPTPRRAGASALVMIPSLLLLGIVRTTALIPAVASITILLLIDRVGSKRSLAIVAAPALVILMIAPQLSEYFGGYRLSYAQMISHAVVDPNEQVVDAFNWQPRSIGRLLVPHSTSQAIAFTLPRLIVYILAPLPNWKGAGVSDWTSLEVLATVTASVLYTALFPLVLGSFRHGRAVVMFHIPFWMTMLAVASGTPLIHERYRVMAIPFFIGCAWLGRMATRRQLAWSYALWGGILLIGGTAAAAYKTLPCPQPVIASQPRSIVTRRGQSVTLTVHVVGEDLSYQWFGGASRFMGAPIRGGTQPALRVSPAVTSSYWLRASDACGHVDSATALITVK